MEKRLHFKGDGFRQALMVLFSRRTNHVKRRCPPGFGSLGETSKSEGNVPSSGTNADFGGFLGMGESYHPLPWKSLTYDTRQGGYVVDMDKTKLQGAPSYRAGEEPMYDRAYGQRVYDYYGVPYGGI
jgi:hypothetical protein